MDPPLPSLWISLKPTTLGATHNVIPITNIPSLPIPDTNFAITSATANVENETPVINNTTTTPLKIPKPNYIEEGVLGTEDDDSIVKQPEKATIMLNHNEALYKEGDD